MGGGKGRERGGEEGARSRSRRAASSAWGREGEEEGEGGKGRGWVGRGISGKGRGEYPRSGTPAILSLTQPLLVIAEGRGSEGGKERGEEENNNSQEQRRKTASVFYPISHSLYIMLTYLPLSPTLRPLPPSPPRIYDEASKLDG